MTDPLSAATALHRALPAVAPDAAAPAAVDPAQAERFAALATPVADAAPAATGLAPLAAPPATASVAMPDGTMGDRLLQGLQQVQGDFQAHLQAVGRLLEPGAPPATVPELLKLQLAMAQLSVQVEVVGKAIGRSTQNLDQLVRMQ